MDRAEKQCEGRLRNANSMLCVGSFHYPLPQLRLVLSSVASTFQIQKFNRFSYLFFFNYSSGERKWS